MFDDSLEISDEALAKPLILQNTEEGASKEVSIVEVERCKKYSKIQAPIVISIPALFNLEIPEKRYLVMPWLKEANAAFLYAGTGVGKTHVAINIALMVATGSNFLNWSAPFAQPVMYVDGEMDLGEFRTRLENECVKSSTDLVMPSEQQLLLMSHELNSFKMPNIAKAEGRLQIEKAIYEHQSKLLILDNLSTLASGFDENKSSDWQPIQDWFIRLRTYGVSVLLVHHAGKDDAKGARGSSKHLDILDTVIELRKPKDYKDEDRARFEVWYIKKRSFYAAPFEAQLFTDPKTKVQHWETTSIGNNEAQVDHLLRNNPQISQREIARKLNISTRTAHKFYHQYKDD